MNINNVTLTCAGFICMWLGHLAQFAGAFQMPVERKIVQRNGQPITAETFVRLGAPLQAELDGQWYAAQAIGLLAEGTVKIHWVGLHTQSDEVVSRNRLKLSVDPLAGNVVLGQTRQAVPVKPAENPFEPVSSVKTPVPPPARDRPSTPPRNSMADMTVEQLVEVIKQRDIVDAGNALDELAKRRPEKPDPEVSAFLEELVLNSDSSIAWNAAKPWEHWATKESIPGLIKEMRNDVHFVSQPALRALVRLHPDDAIAPLVAQLQNFGNSDEAKQAIETFGAKAEPALLDFVTKSTDLLALPTAFGILGKIGTTKSLPGLTALQKEHRKERYATYAIEAIRSRSAKGKPKKGK